MRLTVPGAEATLSNNGEDIGAATPPAAMVVAGPQAGGDES